MKSTTAPGHLFVREAKPEGSIRIDPSQFRVARLAFDVHFIRGRGRDEKQRPGPLPFRSALKIAGQVAASLEPPPINAKGAGVRCRKASIHCRVLVSLETLYQRMRSLRAIVPGNDDPESPSNNKGSRIVDPHVRIFSADSMDARDEVFPGGPVGRGVNQAISRSPSGTGSAERPDSRRGGRASRARSRFRCQREGR